MSSPSRGISSEIAIAALVTAIVSLIILPLPPLLIDSLLAINIALSILLLMAGLYAPTAVALSSFPSMLLFTTLFRLSLNIASTKAILLHANAGHIIESFGRLVVGGNLLVGITVFIIIAAVQFIVIAKGSERASEVSARFALDALPGAQMSIDAELRAGTLSADDARKKRADLALESRLNGSMDGAMKFVKGDAIAGLAITLINIVAGIAVGVTYHEMPVAVAVERFTILSVGDAMVSQLPSLLISVAAGVIITRVLDTRGGNPPSLGQEMISQLGGNATALRMSAVLVLGFAAVPGFPWALFIGVSAMLAFFSWRLKSKSADEEDGDAGRRIPALRPYGANGDGPVIAECAPGFASPIGLKLSRKLASRLLPQRLNEAFLAERTRLEEEYGIPFPGMAIWSSEALSDDAYVVLVQDVPVGEGEVVPLSGVDKQADAETLLARHVIELLGPHAHVFVGIQETQWLFDKLGTEYPSLIGEVQKILPLQRISDVLRRLLEEQVPIRNLRGIVESLIYWGPREKDVLVLTEYVRGDLGRQIAYRAAHGGKRLAALFLHVELEQLIRLAIKPTPSGNFLALPPEQISCIVDEICGLAGVDSRNDLAIVTSMDIRRYVRRMVQPRLSWLNVYSYQELGEYVDIISSGQIKIEMPPAAPEPH